MKDIEHPDITQARKTGYPHESQTRDNYWIELSKRKTDGLLDKPCDDCAVTTGFYLPNAIELTEQDTETQDKVLKSWYCHNDCTKACRGAYNYIHSKRRNK